MEMASEPGRLLSDCLDSQNIPLAIIFNTSFVWKEAGRERNISSYFAPFTLMAMILN